MYRLFNIQQFYVLPTQCIYVFCVDLRTNSDYFRLQTDIQTERQQTNHLTCSDSHYIIIIIIIIIIVIIIIIIIIIIAGGNRKFERSEGSQALPARPFCKCRL